MGELENRRAVVVEDDADVRHLLRTILVRSGFEVILCEDGASGLEAVKEHDPDLLTLDVNMPGMDGFAVARAVRGFSSTYIIMLTGLASEIDVVQGLESGADDYLVKPFRPRELRARIESMMRRPRRMVDAAAAEPTASPDPAWPAALVSTSAAATALHDPVAAPVAHLRPAPPTDAWLRTDGLALNVDTRTVVVDGRTVELSRTEFDLVAALMATGRRVRSKADLVLALRGQNYVTTYFVNEADKRAIEVHMANIRRKLGDSSTTPRWIESVRGVGYRMAGSD